MRFEYDDHDYLVGVLRQHHRSDLVRYVPAGSDNIGRVSHLFWRDVIARFRRGEVWDAVTAIERRFKPLASGLVVPSNNNAYHFVDPAQ